MESGNSARYTTFRKMFLSLAFYRKMSKNLLLPDSQIPGFPIPCFKDSRYKSSLKSGVSQPVLTDIS